MADLTAWEQVMPSVVVCPLSGELGMVPITSRLSADLAARLSPEEKNRHSTAHSSGSPLPVDDLGIWLWAGSASAHTTIALIDLFEFGDLGHERGYVWSNGKLLDVTYGTLWRYLREQAGIEFNARDIDLEKYRGESAAETWALMTRLELPAGGSDGKYYIKRADDGRSAIYRIFTQNGLHGESWNWMKGSWITDENVIRCYWNGFDADVEDASQDDVFRTIRARRK